MKRNDAGATAPEPKHHLPPTEDHAADTDILDSDIGPFFDTTTLSRWLGVSRQAIYLLRRQRVMLAITTLDRRLAFPAWQFGPAKELLPALPEVLELLDPADKDPVGSALWLNASAREFDGATPAELLRRGDRDAVIVVARRIAAAWLT